MNVSEHLGSVCVDGLCVPAIALVPHQDSRDLCGQSVAVAFFYPVWQGL